MSGFRRRLDGRDHLLECFRAVDKVLDVIARPHRLHGRTSTGFEPSRRGLEADLDAPPQLGADSYQRFFAAGLQVKVDAAATAQFQFLHLRGQRLADIEGPPEPDQALADLDEIDIDGLKLRVFHTPGHTPGSVCFYAEGVVFSGDTLFAGSVGRTDLPGGDMDQEMTSIIDRLLVLPDDTIVLPGHMDQTTIGQERQRNAYVRLALAERANANQP